MLKIGSAFLFIASAHANLLSPGLNKCLQLFQGNPGINVGVTTCTDDKNQHFQIAKGSIESQLMQGMCLTADDAVANANVHLAACSPQLAATQKWALTHYGNIKLGASNLCLDIKAGLKADNTRETWNEIKEHEVNNVHLYTCHNPETTDRVNQLWTLAPFKNGQQVMAMTAPVVAAAAAVPAGVVAAPAVAVPAGADAVAPVAVAPSVVAPVVGAAGAIAAPIAAPAVTASMPANVDAALAIQGVAPVAVADVGVPVVGAAAANAAPAATALVPGNVDSALAIQGIVGEYQDDNEATLSTKTIGSTAWGLGCAAVTSSFIVLFGLYRWNSHTPAAVHDDEVEALGTEINDF